MGSEGGFKQVLPPCLFDVGLPTFDVYSDFSLIINWLHQGHVLYAGAMTVPLMLQFLSTISKWVKLEKPKDKRWSWVFLLLQFWPQLRALRWIRLVYKGHPKAVHKMKKMRAEIGTTEAYLEAYPSVVIMTCIFIHAGYKQKPDKQLVHDNNNFYDEHSSNNFQAVFGDYESSVSFILFFCTYAISIITATLGITKGLQIGPCPILSDEGILGGLLTWRFVITYLAVLFSILSKCIFVGIWFIMSIDRGDNSRMVKTLLTFTLLLMPNILFAFSCILISTGCNMKRFFVVILGYPGLWLLPAVTFFSVGPKTFNCCSPNERTNESHKLAISKVATAANIVLTLMTYGITWAIMNYIILPNSYVNEDFNLLLFYLYKIILLFFVPLLIIAIIFCVISIVLDLDCCCKKSQKCLCSCCCGPGCFKFKYEYILINHENNAIEICKSD